MTIRAGGYAQYQGRVYSCLSVNKPYVVLLAPGDQSAPEGFERRPDGRWGRVVERREVDRLFYVKTEATWLGHEVEVRRVLGDTATVWSQATQPPDRPEVSRDRTSWEARVAVSELRDAVETLREVPL